jgi:hypothetical protein
MSYILEKFERWRWIHPLPSNPPKESCLYNEIQITRKKRAQWLSFHNRKNRTSTQLFSRMRLIKQTHLTCPKLKKCFQFSLSREKQPKCGYKCLNKDNNRTFCSNRQSNLFVFGRKNCSETIKKKNNGNGISQKSYKKNTHKHIFKLSYSTWICNFCRKVGKFFRIIVSSSQTSTFNTRNNTSKFNPTPYRDQQIHLYNIDEVMLCDDEEILISNNSSKIIIKENKLQSLSSSDTHKNVKGYFFAQHQESPIDMSVFTPSVWSRKVVNEEKYFDPRLHSNRLDILNQKRLYFE